MLRHKVEKIPDPSNNLKNSLWVRAVCQKYDLFLNFLIEEENARGER